MTIVFSRIDDRLIHGQVVTTWVNQYNVEQIIVLNDNVANDQTQKNILAMAAPAGIKVHAFPVEKFAEIMNKNPITRKTMLLFTNSIDVERAVNSGIQISALNVGGMRFQEGREKISKAVSVNMEEREAFKQLILKGIIVTIQMVPNDEKIDLKESIL